MPCFKGTQPRRSAFSRSAAARSAAAQSAFSRSAAAGLAATVVAAAATLGPVPSALAASMSPTATIDQAVTIQAETDPATPFFVVLKSRPDFTETPATTPAGSATADQTTAGSATADQTPADQTPADGTTTAGSTTASGADRGERARRVLATAEAHAQRAQAGIRALLARRNVPFTPYWIANTIRVTGDKRLVAELAGRPEVERIVSDQVYPLVSPVAGSDTGSSGQGVEWNIDRIGAPKVWANLGARGEQVVVGTIDTGAQFDHPALARQYRGAAAGSDTAAASGGAAGTSDPVHDYNWFDPSGSCPGAPSTPCDNLGHGTHVLGTILGDDGQGNQIGVAPGATWIAAKGCESSGCSTSSLLASGQWMLAPTDRNGEHPRPDLAPHVINNSWSGTHGDPFYEEIITAWVAAGIVPVFAAGNSGPACATVGSPGDYAASFAVGAFDENNVIAPFSSRGPGGFGGTAKPDLAAPGSSIRSSIPGGGYKTLNGTSMAAPHVAGTLALVLSAAPALTREVEALAQLLNSTAIPTPDPACSGGEADNNVWGHGRLDAFEAVSRAPRGATGSLTGVVRSGAEPIGGATVTVTGSLPRTATTDTEGHCLLRGLPAGEATASIEAFGYRSSIVDITVEAETVTVRDAELAGVPRHTLSGRVTSLVAQSVPEEMSAVFGAVVSLPGTPLDPVIVDGAGGYRIEDLPEGTYDLLFDAGNCLLPQRRSITVGSDTTLDVALPARQDGQGYSCEPRPLSWVDAETPLALSGDEATLDVALPFPVEFYGTAFTTANVTTNGYLSFISDEAVYGNVQIPSSAQPNAAVYAFWDDLLVDDAASVRTAVQGQAPNRQFVVEWRDVAFFGVNGPRMTFEVIIQERGEIIIQYQELAETQRGHGSSATVGIENETGTVGLSYTCNEAVLAGPGAVAFLPHPLGSGQG
ncbi:MAG: S8 family serine peptidase [Micromonosporaceae bacterium]|nr:S8 family serine peptidase [Micromonosporaceae bacterium]